MTHVRLISEQDVEQLVDILYEAHSVALLSQGLQLDSTAVSKTMMASILTPEQCPCFVHEDDGVLTGMLFGVVTDTWFVGHKWFEERVFYIRKQYRSFRLARLYLYTLEEWCREQGIRQIELNNASTRSPMLDKLYTRLGYAHVNTTHAKRL